MVDPIAIAENLKVYYSTVEEIDFSKVVDSLSKTELHNLFEALGILHLEITKAEDSSNTPDVNLKAKAVLRFWKQKNGKDATWNALLGALESLKYIHSKQILEEFLKQKYPAKTTPPEGFHLINPDDIKVGDCVGSGGFGNVFKANHKDWGYVVAVKQMSLQGINKSERGSVRKQHLKEAEKMWRAISFPYIVTVMGVIDEPDKAENVSIVMEYFENGSLKDFQKKYMQCDCWARKIKMVEHIALGMNYLHSLDPPIIHRDLKLENVFVGEGFIVKIGDLGLAVSSVSSIQGAGVAGTPSHFPPESSTTEEPNKAWDAFTFAITIYELVSGKDAWSHQKLSANAGRVALWLEKGQRPDLNAIPSKAPKEIIDVIKKTWVTKPKDRPSFKVILKSVTDLFETKFKHELIKSDIAILEQMRSVNESRAASQQKSETPVSDLLEDVPTNPGMSADSHHKQPATWKFVQEIGRKGDGEGEFRQAYNVVVFDNSVMAAVDTNHSKQLFRVYFFNKDCTYKSTLQSNSSNPTEKLLFPMDVAITSKQNLVVVDQSKDAKIFDIQGSYIKSISTLTPDEDPNTKVCTQQVAVTCYDDIVIGDVHRRLLTVHSEADGWSARQIRLDLMPIFLSTNMQGHILVSGRKEKGKPSVVKVLDMSGQEVYCKDTFKVDGKVGCPQGLVCDERGYVYIAVMKFDESGGNVFANSGHIHQYDNQCRFMKCIIKDIYSPRGLAISKTGLDLYIANKKSVLKYSAT